MISSQQQAYDLLKNDPKKLLDSAHYQAVISKVVAKFFAKRCFKNSTPQDIEQAVKTTLIEKKLAQMQQEYNPQVNVQIKYFERLVFSTCKELGNVASLAA